MNLSISGGYNEFAAIVVSGILRSETIGKSHYKNMGGVWVPASFGSIK